ncbi:MAG: phosphatase PAP2/dual specificity phosphatase family protein [Azoarcus sp.]|nr:phosphatase PAP2/dual specificity phosphatase family protein [Azoarcus sp.]
MKPVAPSAVETRWLGGAFKRGVLWLLFLGPFFFLSYGFANQQAALRDAAAGVASFHYAWERGIPLWPWTILPYWSIDLLYGFAFLCCRDRAETKRLGLRLLSAQLICIACFLAWPLRFAFERPPVEGLAGALFTALTSFDLPYNQAPSLHITLLVIVWRQFAAFTEIPGARRLIHAWAILIAVSVLTTWQHHFIDIPTGLAAGLICLWLWPDEGRQPTRKASDRRPALALPYFLGAALILAAAPALGSAALVCGWPALSLALVAFNYAWAGAAGFQKCGGRHSLAARWLFLPYTWAAWVNSRLWTRGSPDPDPICDGVWLGRLPTAREFETWARERGGNVALFDLCAELPAPALPAGAAYDGLPCLDLVPVPASALAEAAKRLDALRRAGREVWVACALGYSRSAAVVAAWLLHTGRAADMPQAVALLQKTRPRVTLGVKSLAQIEECTSLPQGTP